MKNFYRSKNLLKSFYHYQVNSIKIWQPGAGKNKGALILLAIIVFGGLFLTAYMNSQPIMFFVALLVFSLFSAVDFIVYLFKNKHSEIYNIYRIDLNEDEISFFKKEEEINKFKFKDITELEYKINLRREILIEHFLTFSDYFQLKTRSGEEVLIPLDIHKLPLLVKKLAKRANLKKKSSFVWAKNINNDELKNNDGISPFNANENIDSKYLFIFLLAAILYFIYFYLTS